MSPSTYLAPSSCDRNRPLQSQVACKLTPFAPPFTQLSHPLQIPKPQLSSAKQRRPREYSGSCYPEHVFQFFKSILSEMKRSETKQKKHLFRFASKQNEKIESETKRNEKFWKRNKAKISVY
jgi:hypothetical protein